MATKSWTSGATKTFGKASVKATVSSTVKSGPTLATKSVEAKKETLKTPVSSPSSNAVSNPTARTTNSPSALPTATKNSETAFAGITAPFFSLQGQKQRVRNVYETLKIAVNPFSQENISGTTNSFSVNKVLGAVANNPYKTAAIVPIARALPAVASAIPLKSIRAPAMATSSSAAGNTLRNVALAGVGFFAGSVLSGRTPQSTAQDAYLSGQASNTQRTITIDKSQRQTYQDQYSTNTIKDSPYARLGSSQGQEATLPSTISQTPSLVAPFSQEQGLTAQQSQGQDFLIPLLIAIGAVFLLREGR